MSEKKRALIVAPLPPPDHCGISNWSRILRKTLADSPDWELHFVDINARYRAVTNHSLLARLTGGSIHAMVTLTMVYRAMKKLQPEVIHICTSGGLATPRNIISLSIAKHFGVPSMIHYRMGQIPRIFKEKGREWRWTARAMRLADVICTLDRVSEACVRDSLPEKRVITLPNMVEIDELDAICANSDVVLENPAGFHVTFVGQMLPAKGVAELVAAGAKLAGRGLHLNLIGPVSTNFMAKLRETAATAGSMDWFHYHGPKPHDDAVCMMAASDLITLPSYSEGFPNVVAEAMGLGKPILATTVGAVSEMLDIGGPEECGVVVPPRQVEPLAAALERLMSEPAYCLEIGKKARQRAERLYAAPVASRQLTDLWESMIKKE